MKKPIIVLLHIGYWLTYLFLFWFLYFISHAIPTGGVFFVEDLQVVLLFVFLTGIMAFYTYYFWLTPGFLAKKKFLLFTVLGIGVSMAAGLISTLLVNVGIYSLISIVPETKEQISLMTGFTFLALINGILGTIIQGFITWYSEIRIKDMLEKKNLQTELSLLKARLDPHFLFNTLNNIDILIEEDAKSASMYLQKLSGIMRFVLYETQLERIGLAKELDYIEKYIGLQKIRTQNKEYVHMSITGCTDNLQIAPMLFAPFIENAFKHATNKRTKDAITVRIAVADGDIHFTCMNVFNNVTYPAGYQSGLGIALARQRLELLYKDHYQLEIRQTEDTFNVQCTIRLKAHELHHH
jgi:two-component system, LytTR family, sensor kinase